MASYSSEKYQKRVKKIKKLIRNYREEDILDACINYLYAPAENEVDRLKRHPWIVLLVIKWTFIQKSSISYNRYALTNTDFMNILNLTHSLGNVVTMLSKHANANIFIKNIAFQQFIYQEPFSMAQYARQYALFGRLPENSKLSKMFFDEHGITISDFVSLSFAVITNFTDMEKTFFDRDFFVPLEKTFGMDVIDSFLRTISTETKHLKKRLTRYNLSKGGYNEFYEQTPFIHTPLIKEKGHYYCVYPHILYRCIEHFIYDTLKKKNAKLFMDGFGDIYEDYLKIGLNYSELTYHTEDKIKKILGKGSKVVDYLVEESANIFIDAKAVEMPYQGKVSDNPEFILGKIKNTAFKAIEQAYELNARIIESDNNSEIKYNKTSYLLVVTYKELYVGSGKALYHSMAKEKMDQLIEKTPSAAVIPPEHIYFITIDDFDALMMMAKQNGGGISDVLSTAVAHDKVVEDKKFHFKQHINSILGQPAVPEYLSIETDRILEDFAVRLGEDAA